MESITAVEDKLIDGLSFKLGSGASYITNRRSVSFQPQGSNVYEATGGTRLLRIALNGNGWLDPDTLRVSYDMVNKETGGTKNLRMLGGPYSIFRRGRLLCGGTVIEDIDNFNRVSHMLQLLKSKHSRVNDQAEGFGTEWSEHDYLQIGITPALFAAGEADTTVSSNKVPNLFATRALESYSFEGIKPGESQKVLFKPCFGMFNQSKFIPIDYANLILELELVSDPNDPILYSGLYGTVALDVADAGVIRPMTTFYETNCTNQWRIQNVEVKCDIITIDDQLNASYSQHLLSGKSLSISYSTMITQVQTITGQSKPSVNISRALTRLKAAFITFEKDNIVGPYKVGSKGYRSFWSPMAIENGYHTADPSCVNFRHSSEGEFSFQIQNGSKVYPEYPMKGHAEAYSHLRKVMGHKSSDVHSFDISPRQYRDNRFILAIDFEKVTGGEAGWSGENTRSGSLLSIKFEYNNSGNVKDGAATPLDVRIGPNNAQLVSRSGARLADRMMVTLISDNILEINANGVSVFD